MTPKEKAKELVCSYMFDRTDGNTFLIAKKCALIDVNNTIEALNKYSIHSDCHEYATVEYYEEVKQEILKNN